MKFWVISCLFFLYLQFGSAQLSNGPNCNDNIGSCISLKNCPSALLAFQNGVYPETCGFEGSEPLVCCKTETASKRNCEKYAVASTSAFPEFEVFAIVGGQATAPKEFPHMAALGYSNGNNIIFLCGGSLVSEQYVLTAAHCISSIQFVQFTDYIKPACLYINHIIPLNVELIVTGWGLTKYEENKSDRLQKTSLHLFTNEECNNTYRTESLIKLKNGIIHDTQLCAGGKNSIMDSCQGDSGGPLQIQQSTKKVYSIIGITSFRKMCDVLNEPGVYTRVSFYVPWIESVIWPKYN